MKDDAERMASSFAKRADAVTHGDAVGAATALDRPVVDREDYRLARLERDHIRPRLHPRTLLGQHELAAGELLSRPRQQEDRLQREVELAVKVLVQENRLAMVSLCQASAPSLSAVPAHKSTAESRDWLARASAGTDVTVSVCTGAFQLARAGLLKGIPATTHHDFFDSFAKEFPDIELRRGLRFVDSGRIATAGGLTSGIDMALHVVARYFGVEAAARTAEYMEYTSDAWRA